MMPTQQRSALSFFGSLGADGWRLNNEEETHRSPVLNAL